MPDKKTDQFQITWNALEHSHIPKTADWFWVVASAALLLVIIAILTRNFLFGVFAIIAALVFIMLGAKKPGKINFSINPKGIKINSRFYPHKEISSFWMNYEPPRKKELFIKLKRNWNPNLKIPMNDTDPNRLRKYLLNFMKEKKHEQSLVETISDALGF